MPFRPRLISTADSEASLPFATIISSKTVTLRFFYQPEIQESRDLEYKNINPYLGNGFIKYQHTKPLSLTLKGLIDGDYNKSTLQYLNGLYLALQRKKRLSECPDLFTINNGRQVWEKMLLTKYSAEQEYYIPGTGEPSRINLTLSFVKDDRINVYPKRRKSKRRLD